MKATGEVMSIGTIRLNMALMKAVRGAEISLDTPQHAEVRKLTRTSAL